MKTLNLSFLMGINESNWKDIYLEQKLKLVNKK